MKIRLMGTPDECAAAVDALRAAFDLHEVSGFYPNRGDSKLGRVYVDGVPLGGQPVRATAERTDQPARGEITGHARSIRGRRA